MLTVNKVPEALIKPRFIPLFDFDIALWNKGIYGIMERL